MDNLLFSTTMILYIIKREIFIDSLIVMASLLVQATHVQFFNKDNLSDVEKGF